MVRMCVDASNVSMKYGRDAFSNGDKETLAFLKAGSNAQNDGTKNEVAR